VAVYKKGDPKLVNNYRGISLVSCMSKHFTSRVEIICEKYSVISNCLFGFRKGRSTVDAIFILHSVIDSVYVGFIDLKSCFDSICRNSLWMKLYKCCVQGNILGIIKYMYDKVKSCVRYCNTYSVFSSMLWAYVKGR
jgi:hypothetical protein